MKQFFRIVSPELLIWTGGLLLLALYPFGAEHFSVCPFKNLGLTFCPGCGLGLSVHHLFHMDFYHSFQSHPLGIFAVIIISWRILKLARISLTNYFLLTKRSYNG